MANPVALGRKMRGKGTKALGSPQKRRFRITHRAAFHESPQVGKKRFIGGFERFPAGTCPPNPSFRQKTNVCQFTNSLGNHAAGYPRYPVNHFESAPPDSLRLRGGPKPPSFLVKMGPHLTAWQKVQIARHPRRPFTLDYVQRICDSWIELHGDRGFADDHALVTGMAEIAGEKVMIVGHQKGRSTKDNLFRNFGMAHPEGYRKALRVMKLAAEYERPIITLIDTSGAYPGLGAEERGQAEAIARNLFEMAKLPVPILAVVIGEGGSGGALAISVADEIHMLEYSIYSVISPEGCASILYRDAGQASRAAEVAQADGSRICWS